MSACTSMIGNMTVAELALEMLRDSDLVGGASSLYIFIIIPPRPHWVGFVQRDERDCERLPSQSLPIHNHSLQRHGLQDHLA